MCGIAGTIGGTEKAVRGLLYAMQDRGKQSTGLAIIDTAAEGQPSVLIKATEDAWKWASQNYKLLTKTKGNVMIGHTRYATTGAITVENAHPWDVDGVLVGAHNGMIDNHVELDRKDAAGIDEKGQPIRKSEVDSLAAFRHLARIDIKDLLETLGGEIDGYFALEWYDRRTNCVYLAKSGAPIWVTEFEGEDGTGTVYWASEWQPLVAAATAAGQGGYTLIELSDGDLYVYDATKGTRVAKQSFKPAHRNYSANLGKGAYTSRTAGDFQDRDYMGFSQSEWSGWGANGSRTGGGSCGTSSVELMDSDDRTADEPGRKPVIWSKRDQAKASKSRERDFNHAYNETRMKYASMMATMDTLESEAEWEEAIDKNGACRHCFEPADKKGSGLCELCRETEERFAQNREGSEEKNAKDAVKALTDGRPSDFEVMEG